MKSHIGNVKTRLFSVNRMKALSVLYLMEKYPTVEAIDINMSYGHLDNQTQDFLVWLDNKIKNKQQLPNNKQIKLRFAEYESAYKKALEVWKQNEKE
jgi:hypothetical protein